MEHTRDWRFIAFLASAAAAGIHFGATRGHMHEYFPAGSFMLAAGVLQLAWALWVMRGAPAVVLKIGIAGNAALVATWAVSRTAGLPWGEIPWEREHVHGPDILATALEILIVIAAVRLRHGHTRTGEAPAPGALLRLAWAGALTACLIGGDDPVREQLAVLATLANGFALRVFLQARIERGSHETETYVRRVYPRRSLDARAGLEPSG